jgi:uncharacterized protein
MHYAIIAYDAPGATVLRQRYMEAHLAHIGKVLESSQVLCLAGPLKDASGEALGSLLVVDVADPQAALDFMAQDPYHAAGVWSEIRIEAFTPAAGTWIGGRTW